MKVEMETVIDILLQELNPGGSLIDMDHGMRRGALHCVNLLTKINDECSMDVGKYLSLTRVLPDDYPRKRGLIR